MYCHNCKNKYETTINNNNIRYHCLYSMDYPCWGDVVFISNGEQCIYYLYVKLNNLTYCLHGKSKFDFIELYSVRSNHPKKIYMRFDHFIPLSLSEDKLSFNPQLLVNKLLKLINIS